MINLEQVLISVFSKCTCMHEGKMKKFGDISPVWDTWYERLQKGNKGFSFKLGSLTSYIDDAMTEEYGAHENNVLWTRENLRKLKDSIVDKIKSKLNK